MMLWPRVLSEQNISRTVCESAAEDEMRCGVCVAPLAPRISRSLIERNEEHMSVHEHPDVLVGAISVLRERHIERARAHVRRRRRCLARARTRKRARRRRTPFFACPIPFDFIILNLPHPLHQSTSSLRQKRAEFSSRLLALFEKTNRSAKKSRHPTMAATLTPGALQAAKSGDCTKEITLKVGYVEGWGAGGGGREGLEGGPSHFFVFLSAQICNNRSSCCRPGDRAAPRR